MGLAHSFTNIGIFLTNVVPLVLKKHSHKVSNLKKRSQDSRFFSIFFLTVFLIYQAKTLEAHNFVNNNPFLTNLVPKFRSLTGLYNGTKIVKFGPMLTKLGANEVYHVQKNAVYKKQSQLKKKQFKKNAVRKPWFRLRFF